MAAVHASKAIMEAYVIKRVQVTVLTKRAQIQMDHASVRKDIMVNVVKTIATLSVKTVPMEAIVQFALLVDTGHYVQKSANVTMAHVIS